MLTDGLVLAEGSAITNATVAKGAAFPSLPDEGELFFRTDLDALHVYNGTQWIQVGLTSALLEGQTGSYYLDAANATGVLAVLKGGTGVTSYSALVTALGLDIGTNVQAFDLDLAAIAAIAGTTGLLRKTAANTWSLDTSAYLTGNQPITLSGDVSGSGNTNITVTLASVGTAGTYKSVTVNSKGLVTAGTNPTTLAGYGIVDAQALDADLTAIAALAGTSGFLKKTAANTWSLDTASYLPTTGGTMTGNLTMTGSIIPSANITYDLGSPTMMWKDIYVGPGSIYMNGQKILENVSQTIIFSADDNQNIRIETGGTGNLELLTGASAAILVKSTMTITSGKRILDSSGIQVEFGDNIEMNANRITGLAAPVGANDAATKTYVDGLTGNDSTIVRTVGDQTIGGNKTFSGNVTINGAFTSNATTVMFADNILEFNSDFTAGAPTEDAGFQVRRGDSGIVKFIWEEATDRFVMMNGVGGYLDLYTTGTISATTFAGNATTATALATGRTFSVSGDATGTSAAFTGAANASIPMTLATVNSNVGTFGSAGNAVSLTVNAKGLVTAVSQTSITLDASQVTTGAFADGRISSSSVTQHQAALSILESQITDGTIFPRLAGTETVTGTWSFSNSVGVGTPTTSTHAATKQYVDDLVNGVSWKSTARVATTANITLSGTQTIDGIAVIAGDRVLVKNQTTTSQNGVYVVAAGAWTRASDFDGAPSVGEVNGAAVFITDGTVGGDTSWVQTATVATMGTSPIVFAQFSGGAAVSAGAGLTLTGNVMSLTNNTVTIGTSSVALGGTTASLAGLSSLSVTGSVGNATLDSSGARISFTRANANYLQAATAGGWLVFETGGANTRLSIQDTLITTTVPVTGAVSFTSTNDINVDGSNFKVNTTTKSTALYAFDVQRSGSTVGGIKIDGSASFTSVAATSMSATTFTGALSGAASSNVLKSGDTMTGGLITNIGGGASSSLKHIQMLNGSNYELFMLPRTGAGSYNTMTQAGDAYIGFSAGTVDTGALIIGPWATTSKGIRIAANGTVGINTGGDLNAGTGLTGGLNVNGIITAGSTGSVGGSLILAGTYGSLGATTTFGSEFSSGGPSIGYAVRPSTTGAATFTSTVGTSSLTRGALTIAGDTMKFFTGAAQVVAVGTAVTMAERLVVAPTVMTFNGNSLNVNGSGNLLIQHDSTHAYIRPQNAGANLYLGAQAVNTVLVGAGYGTVTGNWFATGQMGANNFTTFSASTGYSTMRNGGASNTGYIEFVAANLNRQGYIGNGTTTGSTDTGNISYVAGTHSFSGSIIGNLTGNSSGTHTGAVVGNADSATRLINVRTINSVGFDGTANIAINLNNNLTFNNSGSGAASGTAFSGSAATTVSYNTVGAPSTTGTNASGTWGINITGNAATASSTASATAARALQQSDGTSFLTPVDPRGASGSRSANLAPSAYQHGLFSEFKNSGALGEPSQGNYSGLLTYANWVGTAASTGDVSYQMLFSPSATNNTTNPRLLFRAGIDSTWGAWTTVLTSLNYNSFVPTLNGTGASGTWGINITGTAPWANVTGKPLVGTWAGAESITVVSGLMGWKNYGNGHVIFDASAGTAPNGASKSNSVPENAWSATYPTLMGWNGTNTYGVKVNRADLADNSSALGGFTPSVSVAASTVVTRDTNGYIFNSYINSSDNSQSSGVSAVMVKAGDNYIRSGTAGAIATFLSGQTMNIAGNASTATSATTATTATNLSGGSVSATSGSFSGQFTTRAPVNYTAITSILGNTAPIAIPQLQVPITGTNFVPFIHGSTVLTGQGYVGHVAFGALRTAGASWTGGAFIGLGQNDAYCTEFFTLGTGGGISHSSGAVTLTGNVTGNAGTVGGLAVSGTVNSNANQIMRTDGSGYANFGWINTVSGDNGTTTPTRIYASSDGYIRFYTPTNFRTAMDLGTLSGGHTYSGSNTFTGTTYFRSNFGAASTVGANSGYALQAYSSDAGAAGMSFHRGSAYAVNFGLDPDNVLRIGGWSASANRWTLDMSGNMYVPGVSSGANLRTTNHVFIDQQYGSSLVGAYDSTKIQGVYAMGASYTSSLDGSSTGSLYGIAWCHPNAGGQSKAGLSHQAIFVTNGTTQTALGTGIWTIGDITAFSDARVKTNVELIGNALSKVEQIRGVTFTRTDQEDTTTRHAGVIAQEVEAVLPEVVVTNADGMKSVAYGNMVALLIEAVKDLSAQNKSLLARLEALESKE